MTMLLREVARRHTLAADGAGAHGEAGADLPVTGRLPDELRGRYLRVGPDPRGAAPAGFCVPSESGGLVHGVLLGEGRARWHRRRRDGRMLPAGEPGQRAVGLRSHPSHDPASGELHAVVSYPDLPFVEHLVLTTDGRERACEPIAATTGAVMSALSLTAQHVVLYDLPARHSRAAELVGASQPYRWDERHNARIGVLDRHAGDGDVRWIDVPPCFVAHPLNAYDEGGRIVLDVVRHERAAGPRRPGRLRSVPTLWRWTVDPAAGRVAEEQLSDRVQEFPTIDDRRRGSRHRFGYAVGLAGADACGRDGAGRDGAGRDWGGRDWSGRAVLKHDLATGAIGVHDVGPGRTVDEPIFVPRTPDAAEDDGWLLAVAHDAGRNRSEILVLDARDVAAPPAAVVHLPVRLPAGCHANWSPAR